jgi:hypothetical protein
MWLLAVAAIMLTSPFLAAWYFRAAKRRMVSAVVAWEHTERHARVLLEDRHLDSKAGDMVEMIVKWSGKRILTVVTLWTMLFSSKKSGTGPLFDTINAQQSDQMVRFMLGAILYDSYRTPFVGALLRHRIMWLVRTATDKTVPVDREQAAPLVKAANRLCPTH